MKLNLMHGLYAGALALFALTNNTVQAQAPAPAANSHITFTWGQEYELPKRHEDLGFVGNASDGYIQIAHRRRQSLTFQKFDSKLQLTAEQDADIGTLPHSYYNLWFTRFGDKYYWFFSTWDRSENKETLFAQEIDIKTGTITGTARELLSTSKIVYSGEIVSGSHGKVTGQWNFFWSNDKSKLMIEYRKKPERRMDAYSNDVIGFFVFDDKLQKVWGREIQMPYTEKKMDNAGFQVDKRGNVYMLAKVYNQERRYFNVLDYHFEILRWGSDKPEVTKIPFRFTDKFAHTATMMEDPKGELVVAGYYSGKKDSYGTDGVFILKLDAEKYELNNVMKGNYEFPVSVLAQYERARTRRKLTRQDNKDNAEAANMVLRDVRISPDSSIQIVGEEYYVLTSVSTGKGSSSSTTYYYNDILVMQIDADGAMKWAQKIPKAQSSGMGQGEMGFKEFTFGNDSYFFFMDRESNLDLDPEHEPDTHNDRARGILVAVKLDQDGHMSKEMVYNGREEKLRITPTDFNDVGNNQIIVRGRARGRDSQAALITFQ